MASPWNRSTPSASSWKEAGGPSCGTSIGVPMYFSLSTLRAITTWLRSASTTTEPSGSGSLANSVSSWRSTRLNASTPTSFAASSLTG